MKNNKIYITTNENAWITSDLFLEYIDNILDYDSHGKRKLLIMDHCTSHDNILIIDKLRSKNIDVVFIPKSMTSILQPLDGCINFPFKKYLKFKYTKFLISKQKIKESLDESRKRIINNVIDIWNRYKDAINKENYIEKELIEKSFKIISITNDMDGNEYLLFDGFDFINQLADLKETIIDNN